MKKFKCFAVAFLTSILMFITTGLFIKLSTSLMVPLVPTRIFIIVLYVICYIKFALLVIMLTPGRPVLKQMSLGFISADMALLLIGSSTDFAMSIPVSLVAVQALLLLLYMALQGRLWLYKANAVNNTIENELIASPI
ncbi:hypothetical protein [Mucilaginibacter sp.]|uniref:hypothetical protein n=1 Tax=Mucilaginibacter sp. TaxID=1882438 RepID=UPI002ED02427